MEASAESPDVIVLHAKRRAALNQLAAERKRFWSEVKRKVQSHQTKFVCANKMLHADYDNSVKEMIYNWNNSKQHEQLTSDVYDLHAAHAGTDCPQISKKDYNHVVGIVHGIVSFNNAGRAGQAGSIRNVEWDAKKTAPGDEEDREKLGVSIPLSVDEDRHNKTGNIQYFFITHDHVELIAMYMDIRERYFEDKVRAFTN